MSCLTTQQNLLITVRILYAIELFLQTYKKAAAQATAMVLPELKTDPKKV